jgi:penicillin-binding protein 2
VHAEQETNSDELLPHLPRILDTITINEQAHWDSIVQAMTDVVHSARGTARKIGKDSPWTIAGKTGTAQVFGLKQDEKDDADAIPEELRDHALFIAYAPVEAPKIAVAVIVENGGGGGSVAAPIARAVLDAYLQEPSP